jgi:hypothetical protein
MAKIGRTPKKRKALTAADVVARHKRELSEWVAGRDHAPDARRAYEVAVLAIRALVEQGAPDVRLVAHLHDVLLDHERGLDAGKTAAPRADLDLADALQAAIDAAGPEGLETARRIAIVGLKRIGLTYEPTVEEIQALVARKGHTLPGLVAMLILKARPGIGEDDRRRLKTETDRVGKSLERTRPTKT